MLPMHGVFSLKCHYDARSKHCTRIKDSVVGKRRVKVWR